LRNKKISNPLEKLFSSSISADPKFKNSITSSKIDSDELFAAFNSKRKYQDGYFNPLIGLEDIWSCRRVSEFLPDHTEEAIDSILFLSRKSATLTTQNIHQGGTSDCYILQCLFSLASRSPGAILALFPYPHLLEKGVVVVKLWSEADDSYRLFIFDDRLPANENEENLQWFCSSPGGPDKNVFWCALLEKCFAKIAGGFLELDASTDKLTIDDIHSMILGKGTTTVTLDTADESSFEKLIRHYKKGNIISLSSQHSDEFVDRKTGMVNYHGYALVEVREDVASSGLTLIKCMNVSGSGGDFLGDKFLLWKERPEIKEALRFEVVDDGVFWISREYFSVAFSVVWIAVRSEDLNEDDFSLKKINDLR